MFVRWQARQRGPKSRPDEAYTLWTASLVTSERQDGQPRKRHLAYLGCFREYAKRWWNQATYQDAVILKPPAWVSGTTPTAASTLST
jgi:hypothetical protein